MSLAHHTLMKRLSLPQLAVVSDTAEPAEPAEPPPPPPDRNAAVVSLDAFRKKS